MGTDMGEKAAMEQNIRRFSPSGEASGGGLSVVKAQEKQPKPVLQPSPGLGGWLQQVSGSLCFTTYQTSRLLFLFAHEQADIPKPRALPSPVASLGAASASGKDFFRPIMTITGKGQIRPACHPMNQR